MWEFWILAALIVIGFGVAIYMVVWKHGARSMAHRIKTPKVIVHNHSSTGTVDTESIAAIVAKAVAESVSKNLLDRLEKLQYSGEGRRLSKEELQIAIDESIIPVNVDAMVDKINIDGMAKEETHEDTGLAGSKAKLANLLKKKENK